MTPEKRESFRRLIERHTRVNTVSGEAALASLAREGLRERGTLAGDDLVPAMLAQVRRMTGWSRERLASALGHEPETIHDWTLGREMASDDAERLVGLHATLAFIDRGSAEENRELLATGTADGRSAADLLDKGRFDEVCAMLGAGSADRDTSRWTRQADAAYRERLDRDGHWFDRIAETDGAEAVLESPAPEMKRPITVRRG